MANALTTIRILCGLLIAFLPAFSGWFYLCYLIGGFTDAIDGTVARKLNTATSFGAKFDTVADVIFFGAVIIKILRNFFVPLWVIIWIVCLALLKAASALIGFLKHGRLVAVHSLLNKLAGIAVFITPLVIGLEGAWQAKAVGIICVCILATVSAIQEFVFIWNGKDLT